MAVEACEKQWHCGHRNLSASSISDVLTLGIATFDPKTAFVEAEASELGSWFLGGWCRKQVTAF